ncbi:hypothetical protein [Lacunimicrobium album]
MSKHNRDYDVVPLVQLPNMPGVPVYYYPGASIEGGKGGALYLVKPDCGQNWVGVFAYGDCHGMQMEDGPFADDRTNYVSVLSDGLLYRVDVTEPTCYCVETYVTTGSAVYDPVSELVILVSREFVEVFRDDIRLWRIDGTFYDLNEIRLKGGLVCVTVNECGKWYSLGVDLKSGEVLERHELDEEPDDTYDSGYREGWLIKRWRQIRLWYHKA